MRLPGWLLAAPPQRIINRVQPCGVAESYYHVRRVAWTPGKGHQLNKSICEHTERAVSTRFVSVYVFNLSVVSRAMLLVAFHRRRTANRFRSADELLHWWFWDYSFWRGERRKGVSSLAYSGVQVCRKFTFAWQLWKYDLLHQYVCKSTYSASCTQANFCSLHVIDVPILTRTSPRSADTV